jgi:hypothetical protein
MDKIPNNIDECMDNFNCLFRNLLTTFEQKYSDNELLYRLKQRIFLALRSDASLIIIEFGPILWNNRSEILNNINNKDDLFLNFDYEGEVSKRTNNKDNKMLYDLINYLKREYEDLQKEEKEYIYNTIKGMLVQYTYYLKLIKNK